MNRDRLDDVILGLVRNHDERTVMSSDHNLTAGELVEVPLCTESDDPLRLGQVEAPQLRPVP